MPQRRRGGVAIFRASGAREHVHSEKAAAERGVCLCAVHTGMLRSIGAVTMWVPQRLFNGYSHGLRWAICRSACTRVSTGGTVLAHLCDPRSHQYQHTPDIGKRAARAGSHAAEVTVKAGSSRKGRGMSRDRYLHRESILKLWERCVTATHHSMGLCKVLRA